jgi:hypothetical protein
MAHCIISLLLIFLIDSDQENSRYLGKGLYAAGIRNTDVVVNFLSAGFWGGMHVFNLALSYTGTIFNTILMIALLTAFYFCHCIIRCRLCSFAPRARIL